MGNEGSKEANNTIPDIDGADLESQSFQRTQYKQMSEVGNDLFGDDDFDEPQAQKNTNNHKDPSKFDVQVDLTQMPYNGTWLTKISSSMRRPFNRTCHFSVQMSPAVGFIGFGKNQDGKLLSDVWEFNNQQNTWRQININTNIPPRYGATAAIMGKLIVVYGGIGENEKPYDELITINIDDGSVAFVQTNGSKPPPLSFAPIGVYDRKICVFSGNAGLFILDITNLTWKHINSGRFQYSSKYPWCVYNEKIYVVPENIKNENSFIVINMEQETVCSSAHFDGSGPYWKNQHSLMTCVGDYIFYFGGENESYVYAYLIEKSWWFVFFMLPDTLSSTITEGTITKEGLFKLPILHSNSVFYNSYTREISICAGYPFHDLMPTGYIRIGEALNFCHLREDLDNMLQK